MALRLYLPRSGDFPVLPLFRGSRFALVIDQKAPYTLRQNMARRASSSVHPAWLVVLIILAGVLGAGGYWLFSQANDSFRTLTAFPAEAYLENSDGVRGNVYRVEGTISDQLSWSPNAGRLISVNLEAGGNVVALLVPGKFNSVNIQKGQHFTFEVEVAEKGVLKARALRKA